MSTKWTYSGDPSSSKRDAVRFKVGDTNPTDMIFTDAEVDYAVDSEGSVNEASIMLARAALAKYARLVETSDGQEKSSTSRSYQQRVEHFKELVLQLVGARGKRVLGIYAGGISLSDKQTNNADTDRVRPEFTRAMHEGPVSPVPVKTVEEDT